MLGQMNWNFAGSIYKDCSFHPDPLTNMAAIGYSCFWLVRQLSAGSAHWASSCLSCHFFCCSHFSSHSISNI